MAESVQATALRKGTAVLFEGVPYRVLAFEHRTQGRKSGFSPVQHETWPAGQHSRRQRLRA